MADHLLRRDPHRLRYVVRNVQIRGPDRTDDLRHGRGAGVRLDGVPEEGGDGAGDDGELGEMPAEGGAHGDGEGDVQAGADGSVEDEGDSTDEAAEDDADDGLAPGIVSLIH